MVNLFDVRVLYFFFGLVTGVLLKKAILRILVSAIDTDKANEEVRTQFGSKPEVLPKAAGQ